MRAHRGFTLIELMIVIALLAITAAFAIPNYIAFVNRQTVQSEANAFSMDLRFARSEAARLNTAVRICGTVDGTTCSGSWSDKRIVFADGGTQGVVDGSDTVTRATDKPKAAVTITATGFLSAGQLKIRATGQPEASIALTFCTGTGNASAGRTVSMSSAGKPSLTTVPCS